MKNIILITTLSLLFTSCEKAFFDKEVKATNPVENFEYLWKQCDEKYAFFDYKGIDWNERYQYYKGRINDDMSQEALFNELADMMNDLRDGHVNLISDFNVSGYKFNFLGPDNIDERIVEEFYLTKNEQVTGPFRHNFVGNKQVGYIRLASFPGSVTDDHLNYMIDKYAGTKGLILDVRQNGGGAISDVFKIISHFVSSRSELYETYTKSGPGHNDFSGPEIAYANPSGKIFSQKIIVLTDRGTFSSGSHFTLAMRNLPQVTIMGDTTGGGMGLPNGGQLPNGWTYRFSITRTLDLDGANYEGGIPPDKVKFINRADTDKDAVIEAAITEITQ